MDAILGALPQLVDVVQKGGVAGILILISAVLGYEVLRLRKDLSKTYHQRDKWRLAFVKCKAALEANKVALPDLSDLADLDKEIA